MFSEYLVRKQWCFSLKTFGLAQREQILNEIRELVCVGNDKLRSNDELLQHLLTNEQDGLQDPNDESSVSHKNGAFDIYVVLGHE
jgi:hypothetical protein